MVNEMNFYVTAEPRNMDHLHAFYVAGKIVAHPFVKLKLPSPFSERPPKDELDKYLTARSIMHGFCGITEKPKVNFQIENKSYSVNGVIRAYRPYSGDSLKVNFGPYNTDLIQTAHDDLKKFMEEAEKRLPQVEDVTHFHVIVTPNPKIFKVSEEIEAERIEEALSKKGLERTGQIARFEVCGHPNGYEGKICGLAEDEVPFGVIEWQKGNRSIWDRYYLYPLRKSKKSR
jgi:hypothetical protein